MWSLLMASPGIQTLKHGQKAGLGSMWSTTKKRWSNSTIMGLGYQTVPLRGCLEDITDNCFIVILLLMIAEDGGRGSWRESSVRLQCPVSLSVRQDFITPNISSNIVQSTLGHNSVSILTHDTFNDFNSLLIAFMVNNGRNDGEGRSRNAWYTHCTQNPNSIWIISVSGDPVFQPGVQEHKQIWKVARSWKR